MRYHIAILLAFLSAPVVARASIVESLDFSGSNDGVTHTTFDGFSSSSPYNSVTGDWVLTWDSGTVSTDTTLNQFTTLLGGFMRVQDWGGAGTLQSSTPWVATESGVLNIAGVASTIGGSNVFNSAGEGLTWFYSINSGANTNQFLNNDGSLDHTFENVFVSAGDSVIYGFTVNVEGEGDGAQISSMTLDFRTIPEPTTLPIVVGALFMTGLRRKRGI
ncbi:MAG: PEP-CTERM sorting domain-containing protein [Pirellulaceae bacterium]|nr:PEP-CTERM sorting domain-containing protein [Pirellulaceae bacterium]